MPNDPGAYKIQPGAGLSLGILGNDLDVVAWRVVGVGGPYTKKRVLDEVPGNLGDPSDEAPNAVLVQKRFGGYLTRETDGSWSALAYSIYRSNNAFGGGIQPFGAYARNWIDHRVPVYQEHIPGSQWKLHERVIQRQHSMKVVQKIVDEGDDDYISEIIDPLVGALTWFTNNGQPYRFLGADMRFSPGSPRIVEYRFETTGRVQAFGAGGVLGNSVPIPSLGPLDEYVPSEPPGAAPMVGIVVAADLYENFNIMTLPGYS